MMNVKRNWQLSTVGWIAKILIILTCVTPLSSFGREMIIGGTWWKDMKVEVIPLFSKSNAIYAIEVVLSNRSMVDTARFQEAGSVNTIDLDAIGVKPGEGDWAKPFGFGLKNESRREERKIIEIAPGKSISYCLKMQDAIRPATAAATARPEIYLLIVSVFGQLSWKRQNGYTTPFGYESEKVLAKAKYKLPVYVRSIELGEHKLDLISNKGCGDK